MTNLKNHSLLTLLMRRVRKYLSRIAFTTTLKRALTTTFTIVSLLEGSAYLANRPQIANYIPIKGIEQIEYFRTSSHPLDIQQHLYIRHESRNSPQSKNQQSPLEERLPQYPLIPDLPRISNPEEIKEEGDDYKL